MFLIKTEFLIEITRDLGAENFINESVLSSSQGKTLAGDIKTKTK